MIHVIHMQIDFFIFFRFELIIKQLFTKSLIYKKLPQISHINKSHNFYLRHNQIGRPTVFTL